MRVTLNSCNCCIPPKPAAATATRHSFRRANFLISLAMIVLTSCQVQENSAVNGASQAAQQNSQAEDFIGFANMEADGAIVLRLDATTEDGSKAHGYFRYPPDHPEYAAILRHVGPLKPGETARVRPWSETAPTRKQDGEKNRPAPAASAQGHA